MSEACRALSATAAKKNRWKPFQRKQTDEERRDEEMSEDWIRSNEKSQLCPTLFGCLARPCPTLIGAEDATASF